MRFGSQPFRPLLALTAVLALAGPLSADVITPDAILRPPPGNVGSAQGSIITSLDNLVTTQYATHGLIFPAVLGSPPGTGPAVAITSLGGVNVWAPAGRTEAMPFPAVLDYRNSITGQLVKPVNSLTLEVIGVSGGMLSALDSTDHLLGTSWFGNHTGPHGGTLLTVNAVGISAFTITPPLLPLAFPQPQPWGVAEVAFTPAPHAPEPGTLLLALLGALGLAVGSRQRRRGTRSPAVLAP
jgi:hypothetical protein